MYEDLQSVDFGTLHGAGTGQGQGIEKLIKALYGTLATGGYFGTEYTTGGDKYGTGLGPSYRESSGRIGKDSGGFTIDNVIKFIEEGNKAQNTDQEKGMMSLAGLLKKFQSKDVVGGYTQNMGSISAEIGSQFDTLQKGYGVTSKGGRYGTLGTGGRQLGEGGRQKYASDYYSLIDRQNEMQQNLQESTMEDFTTNVGQWMSTHPVV